MDNKEEFKSFVRRHPSLANKVSTGQMSWQKFYELYYMYGEDSSVWSTYLENESSPSKSTNDSLHDLVNLIKKLDFDTVRRGINGLQKAIGIVQEISPNLGKNNNLEDKPTYEPRPMYKYFED